MRLFAILYFMSVLYKSERLIMPECDLKITNERIRTTLTTHDFFYELPEELIALLCLWIENRVGLRTKYSLI